MAEDGLDAADDQAVCTWNVSIWEEGSADGFGLISITYLRTCSVTLEVLWPISKSAYWVETGTGVAVTNQLGLRSSTRPWETISNLQKYTR